MLPCAWVTEQIDIKITFALIDTTDTGNVKNFIKGHSKNFKISFIIAPFNHKN